MKPYAPANIQLTWVFYLITVHLLIHYRKPRLLVLVVELIGKLLNVLFAVFNWVLVKFKLDNTIFGLNFLYNTNCSIILTSVSKGKAFYEYPSPELWIWPHLISHKQYHRQRNMLSTEQFSIKRVLTKFLCIPS